MAAGFGWIPVVENCRHRLPLGNGGREADLNRSSHLPILVVGNNPVGRHRDSRMDSDGDTVGAEAQVLGGSCLGRRGQQPDTVDTGRQFISCKACGGEFDHDTRFCDMLIVDVDLMVANDQGGAGSADPIAEDMELATPQRRAFSLRIATCDSEGLVE